MPTGVNILLMIKDARFHCFLLSCAVAAVCLLVVRSGSRSIDRGGNELSLSDGSGRTVLISPKQGICFLGPDGLRASITIPEAVGNAGDALSPSLYLVGTDGSEVSLGVYGFRIRSADGSQVRLFVSTLGTVLELVHAGPEGNSSTTLSLGKRGVRLILGAQGGDAILDVPAKGQPSAILSVLDSDQNAGQEIRVGGKGQWTKRAMEIQAEGTTIKLP